LPRLHCDDLRQVVPCLSNEVMQMKSTNLLVTSAVLSLCFAGPLFAAGDMGSDGASLSQPLQLAQDQERDRLRDPTSDQDSDRTQDRVHDRIDQTSEPDRDQTQDRLRDPEYDQEYDRTRDRDRIHQ
jgi:hypothetical protein